MFNPFAAGRGPAGPPFTTGARRAAFILFRRFVIPKSKKFALSTVIDFSLFFIKSYTCVYVKEEI